ncbi:hypothetical protein [Halobacillus litoralis]|uniref:Uncharacterized protein n=1 Tax=Halobacillus litoralis TaxID=45668 RepID=A0A410MCC4_9BACI|nr:hypothetical protein [Halobacillus litoralis]QAS52392.1 hypothetical protein HLI_09175 [Halobacillus litoralis]
MRIIKNNFFAILILASLIIADIFIYLGIVKLFLGWNDTIIAGFIGFIGAVLGGTITLVGVLITIKENEKLRKKDEFPKKIDNIERCIIKLDDGVTEISKINERIDPYSDQGTFHNVNNEISLELTDAYEEYTKNRLNNIQSDIVYIGSDTYELFLNFRSRIRSIENSLMLNPIRELEKFKHRIVEKYDLSFESLVGGISLSVLSREELNEYTSIKINIHDKDQEFIFSLQDEMISLISKLQNKKEELLRELNG